jgi:hypothetical protein
LKPDHDQSPDESAQREAVFAEWEKRAQKPPRQGWRGLFRRERWQDQVDADAMGEEDAYVAPTKRAAFPPSFLLLWGLGLAFLALEPTLDLRYTLFGPSTAVELGEPGAFHLEAAAPNVRARVTDWAHSDRGTYSQTLSDYEVLALTSVPVLVRRAPEGRPPPNTAELYRGEGRLLRLDNVGSSFLERWVSPAARYATVRQQFQALGQLPMTGPCWLLLEGDLPRSTILPLVAPLLLWVGAFLFLFSAWRSYRLRHSRR